jgi:hypothetical protein
VKPDRATVPKADGVPAAWLADDAIVRGVPSGDRSGTGRTEALLPDRPDDGDGRVEVRSRRRSSGDEGAKGSLGVDRAAAPQLAVLDADRDVSGDRVDVAEEHDLACS